MSRLSTRVKVHQHLALSDNFRRSATRICISRADVNHLSMGQGPAIQFDILNMWVGLQFVMVNMWVELQFVMVNMWVGHMMRAGMRIHLEY